MCRRSFGCQFRCTCRCRCRSDGFLGYCFIAGSARAGLIRIIFGRRVFCAVRECLGSILYFFFLGFCLCPLGLKTFNFAGLGGVEVFGLLNAQRTCSRLRICLNFGFWSFLGFFYLPLHSIIGWRVLCWPGWARGNCLLLRVFIGNRRYYRRLFALFCRGARLGISCTKLFFRSSFLTFSFYLLAIFLNRKFVVFRVKILWNRRRFCCLGRFVDLGGFVRVFRQPFFLNSARICCWLLLIRVSFWRNRLALNARKVGGLNQGSIWGFFPVGFGSYLCFFVGQVFFGEY